MTLTERIFLYIVAVLVAIVGWQMFDYMTTECAKWIVGWYD